jgi:hypothetical protein
VCCGELIRQVFWGVDKTGIMVGDKMVVMGGVIK